MKLIIVAISATVMISCSGHVPPLVHGYEPINVKGESDERLFKKAVKAFVEMDLPTANRVDSSHVLISPWIQSARMEISYRIRVHVMDQAATIHIDCIRTPLYGKKSKCKKIPAPAVDTANELAARINGS